MTQSIDCLYREMRSLSASISNTTSIERVYESILNYSFYTVLVFTCLAVLGFDSWTLGILVASVGMAFSFGIGSASGAIFEGILMILLRRPFGTLRSVWRLDFLCNWLTLSVPWILHTLRRHWRSHIIVECD